MSEDQYALDIYEEAIRDGGLIGGARIEQDDDSEDFGMDFSHNEYSDPFTADTSYNNYMLGEHDESGDIDEFSDNADMPEQDKQNVAASKANREKYEFNLEFIKKYWRKIRNHKAISPIIDSMNLAVSSTVSASAVYFDYLAWLGIAITSFKFKILNPKTRLDAIIEIALFDDGIAGALFGLSREYLDNLLKLVSPLGRKIIEQCEKLGILDKT